MVLGGSKALLKPWELLGVHLPWVMESRVPESLLDKQQPGWRAGLDKLLQQVPAAAAGAEQGSGDTAASQR